MTIEQELPEEENFESLVARLRPLTVQKEPIHYAKVLAAIETALSASWRSGKGSPHAPIEIIVPLGPETKRESACRSRIVFVRP